MNIKKLSVAVLLFWAGINFCIAGGFQTNTQGVKAMTIGGSLSAIASDASIVFFNPGGAVFLNKSCITIGGIALIPKVAYLSPLSGKQVDMDNQTFFPMHFYTAIKFKEKYAAGLSINSPYLFGTKWDSNWEGKYISQQASFKSSFIQPTFSAKISEKFGVGAGFIYALGKSKLTKAIDVESSTTQFGTENLKSNGHGIGFNIGAFIKMDDKVSFAISYRSKIKIEMKDGKATFSDIPASQQSVFPQSTTYTTSVKLPAVISLSVSYAFTQKMKMQFEINYTGWSVYDSLVYTFPYQYSDLNTSSHDIRKYKNTAAVRVGIEWQPIKLIALNAGASYDQTPVKNGYVTPDFPDGNKFGFALGLTFTFSEKFSLDIGYAFDSLKERQDVNSQTNFGGSFKSNIHSAGIGINYNF